MHLRLSFAINDYLLTYLLTSSEALKLANRRYWLIFATSEDTLSDADGGDDTQCLLDVYFVVVIVINLHL